MYVSYLFPGGRSKAITLSYDDGQIFDRRLVSIFNEYKIRATFFLNSANLGRNIFIEPDEVSRLYQGHEVGVHTKTHPFLDSIPVEAAVEEIMEDRKALEKLVGYPVKGMSYPYGVYNEDIVKILPSLGIEYSRTVISTFSFNLPSTFLAWHPTCHHNQDLLDISKKFLESPYLQHLQLLYIWGHSFEFKRENNWHIIENFCKLVSKFDSVWFATNIEIVRYVKALKMLEFSADKEIVYNPSATSIWLLVDGNPVEVKGGQMVNLK
ncbi:polysaccharide deacetylase family protein [Caldicellulosiruptor morganii]|uniref:Polysaccharide deacetylase family protein n=1 Tax=Caldicellulosiruptor morganii TaxID=1387555 RepID=A0ABY7BQN7_9FIRM|nr:polysaccharide deacetylase family protein [Caldicellulosiruptor morganii]WAM33744.1 polysaccharide deacetylase family protein [Caldicellulosiruptor morganii]